MAPISVRRFISQLESVENQTRAPHRNITGTNGTPALIIRPTTSNSLTRYPKTCGFPPDSTTILIVATTNGSKPRVHKTCSRMNDDSCAMGCESGAGTVDAVGESRRDSLDSSGD